jgi:aminopeptidase N
MFDQPDLKARFSLTVIAHVGWQIVSDSMRNSVKLMTSRIPSDNFSSNMELRHDFDETQPISTYMFCLAAGPFERFVEGYNKSIVDLLKEHEASHPELYAKGAPQPTDFYRQITDEHLSNTLVRKSLAAKFQPQAAEIFKTARETDKYFDHKSAWPKYDLVLIPDLPSEMVQAAGITFVRESSIIGDR